MDPVLPPTTTTNSLALPPQRPPHGVRMLTSIAALVAGTFTAATIFAVALDLMKIPVFAHLGMAEHVAISQTRGQQGKPSSTTPSAKEQDRSGQRRSARHRSAIAGQRP